MKSFKWVLIAAGTIAIGSLAIALGPDVRRYLRMRAM
jgi:hypothetical protein